MILDPRHIPQLLADVMLTASKQPALQGLFTQGSYLACHIHSHSFQQLTVVADKNLVFSQTPLRTIEYAWGSTDLIPVHRHVRITENKLPVKDEAGKDSGTTAVVRSCAILMYSNQRNDDNPNPLTVYDQPAGYFIGKWINRDCEDFAGFIFNHNTIHDDDIPDETLDYQQTPYTLTDLEAEVAVANPEGFALTKFDYDTIEPQTEYLICNHSDEYYAPLLHTDIGKSSLNNPQQRITVVGYNSKTFRKKLPFYVFHNGAGIYVTDYEIESMRLCFETLDKHTSKQRLDVACYTRIHLKEVKHLSREAISRTQMMSHALVW